MDVGLDHMIWIYTPPMWAKTQEREISRDGRAIEAHGIATNIDPSTQAWHGAPKHIDLNIGT